MDDEVSPDTQLQGSDESSEVSQATQASDKPTTAPLHPADTTRAKRLSYILNTLKNLPDHVNTLVFGDSNTHKVRGQDVDPRENRVCVRSFSGLCIPAAAHALEQYKNPPYGKIRRVNWCLGVNDILHHDQHCPDDVDAHIKSLYSETKRIFPHATVGFILPFVGINAMTPEHRKGLEGKLKALTPAMKLHYPPNMTNMLLRDGVHLNNAGKQAYINFLSNRFAGNKPNPRDAPQNTRDTRPLQKEPRGQNPDPVSNGQSYRARRDAQRLPSSYRYSDDRDQPREYSQPDFSELATVLTDQITDVLTRTMQSWGTQRRETRYPQLWPSLRGEH